MSEPRKYKMFDDDPETQAVWDALPGYETREGCEIRFHFYMDYLAKRYGRKRALKLLNQVWADFQSRVITSNSKH